MYPSRIALIAFSVAALVGSACGGSEKPDSASDDTRSTELPGHEATNPAAVTSPDRPPEAAATPASPDVKKALAFSLTSHDGTDHSLESLLAGGPTVLVFYRGHW